VTARRFAHDLVLALVHHRVKDMAAQLAFWLLLAIFPFFIFLLTVIGFIPLHGLEQEALGMLEAMMPADTAKMVNHVIHEVIGRQRGLLLVASLVGSLWSASGGAGSVIQALHRAYGITETRSWLRVRTLALLTTFGTAATIIVATVGLLVGPNLLHSIWEYFGVGKMWAPIWRIARWPVVIVALLVTLESLYHFLPAVRRKFRVISPGSAVAVFLWISASGAFKLYLRHFQSFSKTYGALGGAVILLVWLYLSALMVIIGGEINACLDRLNQRSEAESEALANKSPEPPRSTNVAPESPR
jgi:membrane protein